MNTPSQSRRRSSRVFTISFPEELAQRVEATAKAEHRTISELFRETFRAYQAERVREALEIGHAYASSVNPNGYTEDDVPLLVKEVRAEIAAERAAKLPQ